jgi:adenylate cyclase
MVGFRAREMPVAVIGGICLTAVLLVWGSGVFNLRENIRELTFDKALPLLAPRTQTSAVIVVDIDSDSLTRHGPWPWGRLVLADLLTKIAQAKPKVIGLDVLLSEPDRLSAVGILRNIGNADRAEIAQLASKLPDGDAAVADALNSAPSVLGFVLHPAADTPPPPGVPTIARGHISAPEIWQTPGVIMPLPTIAAAARGFGAIVLAGDANGEIRRVPVLVMVGGYLRPGFAVEMLRVNYEAASFILDGAQQRLRIGPLSVPIDADAALRILPEPEALWTTRTIPAWRILSDEGSRAQLTGRIVLVGSGAPEVGDLRATPVSATTPSVQIQADAVTTLLRNVLPRRPSWVPKAELFGAAALGLVAIAIAIFRRPVAAAALVGLLCLSWLLGAVSAFVWKETLIDMAGPPLVAVMAFAATTLGGYAQNEQLVRALRRRFEQHLAPDVVERLVNAPNMLRLSGESREVTALFTDIEGFTSLTDRSNATEVLQLLDEYLTIVTDIVVAHGGMVDKLIGDGVFALFNAPLDLPDHTRHAVAAAKDIIAATEEYRTKPLAVRLALGRTRIGIESGTAIVGDVGGGTKLDYTAFGNVVNTASRLEGVNKEFGTSICIGPTAASMMALNEIERLGTIQLRGRSATLEVFTLARGA